VRVRTCFVPGEFYEANPGSSTRNTGTLNSTSKLVRPRGTNDSAATASLRAVKGGRVRRATPADGRHGGNRRQAAPSIAPTNESDAEGAARGALESVAEASDRLGGRAFHLNGLALCDSSPRLM
jgi:hypothetical protein